MINLLFSGNEKVFDGVLSCMLSIFKRTKTKEPFRIFVYTMDVTRMKPEYTAISEKMVTFLDKVAKQYNSNNSVIRVDVTALYEKEFAHCPNEDAYCSPYTLLRLFADEVPDMPDKILYLDVDILFNRDICLLYDTDVSDVEYAAARDHYGKYLIRPDYVNAGVLLLNLKKIKESAVIRSTSKKKMLPQKFNDQKFLHKSTVVRHFSKRLFYLPYPHIDNIKQWRVSDMHRIYHYYAFDDVLYEYLYLKRKFELEY